MTIDNEQWNADSKQYINWWLDTVHQGMQYQNEQLKSKLDCRHANISNFPPVIQNNDKQLMNDVANLYTDWLQNLYELSLNQFSIASEWSERIAHFTQKSVGTKTIDS